MTGKVAAFQTEDGTVHIVRPVPWARLVKSIKVGGVEQKIKPPQALERVTNIRTQEHYAAFVANVPHEFAETEDEFIARVCDETVPVRPAVRVGGVEVIAAQGARRKVVPEGVQYHICTEPEKSEYFENRMLRRAVKIVNGELRIDREQVEREGLIRDVPPARVVRT